MSGGIEATRLDDGTVCIVATAKGGTIRLRVSREYARRLAARLITASMEPGVAEPSSVIDRFAELFTKRGGR